MDKVARTYIRVLPKAGVPSIYNTFVLNRALVFQINSSAEFTPPSAIPEPLAVRLYRHCQTQLRTKK